MFSLFLSANSVARRAFYYLEYPMRHLSIALATALCLSTTCRALTYIAVDLTPSGVTGAAGLGLAAGQQVGDFTPAGGFNSHAALWNGSADSVVDLHPAGWRETTAVDTNGVQQIGHGYVSSLDHYHALVWSGSAQSVIDLHPAAYGLSIGLAIAGDQQVGYAANSSYIAAPKHAMLWHGSAASVIDLTPAYFSSAEALDTDGIHQVGDGVDEFGYTQALLWSGTAGSVVQLHQRYDGVFTSAVAVYCNQEVGHASAYGNPAKFPGTHAMLWSGSPTTEIDLHPAGFNTSFATDTNGAVQVGYATSGGPHAVAWQGSADSFMDLHQFLQQGMFGSSAAYGIDAAGNILGTAQDYSGVQHAILWVPAPEPTSLSSLALGILPILCRRRKPRERA
jgi:hypothetical protein